MRSLIKNTRALIKYSCKEKKIKLKLNEVLHLTTNLRKYKGQRNMLNNTTGIR